jgi:hypothetical protein
MSDGIQIGPSIVQVEDGHIAVRILSFRPDTGMAELLVDEKVLTIGYYYIFVYSSSGDSTRIDYDGGNPSRPKSYTIQTSHRGDVIVRVEAKKVR